MGYMYVCMHEFSLSRRVRSSVGDYSVFCPLGKIQFQSVNVDQLCELIPFQVRQSHCSISQSLNGYLIFSAFSEDSL